MRSNNKYGSDDEEEWEILSDGCEVSEEEKDAEEDVVPLLSQEEDIDREELQQQQPLLDSGTPGKDEYNGNVEYDEVPASFGIGIKQKMTKWLNPEVTTADLGEGMQAYYDEKRKVWVFPGEPIAPPPVIPKAATTDGPMGGKPQKETEQPNEATAAAGNLCTEEEKEQQTEQEETCLLNPNVDSLLLQGEDDTPKENEELSKNQEDNLTPAGVCALQEMGFPLQESKIALDVSNGDVQQAISHLLGEHTESYTIQKTIKDASRRIKTKVLEIDEKLELSNSTSRVVKDIGNKAKSVSKSIGKEAERAVEDVKKAYKKQNIEGKAKVAAHKAKLAARGLSRDAKTMNERYHVTDTVAIVGSAVAASMLLKGNMKAVTVAAAVAGTSYVLGESMKKQSVSANDNLHID